MIMYVIDDYANYVHDELVIGQDKAKKVWKLRKWLVVMQILGQIDYDD